MADLNNLVQKALYLGIGIADYAAEKAKVNLQDLRSQAQKLADEMVARGEMNLEEARKYVDELVQKAQQDHSVNTESTKAAEPRRIEIIEDDEESQPVKPTTEGTRQADELRRQVEDLQAELRRLQQD